MEAAYSQACAWAQAQLAGGIQPEALVSGLMTQGWSELQAREVLDVALTGTPQVAAARPARAAIQYASPAQRPVRSAGASAASSRHAKGMVIGGVICAIGLGITVVTYSSASSSGGSYMVCWGAIIFGFIRFVRGLAGWMSGG